MCFNLSFLYQFADIEATMATQFDMLLGNLPEGYSSDFRLIVYVVLTNIVMFFLVSLPKADLIPTIS